MGSNPWLAIDAGTLPQEHARRLRLAWEQFLDGGEAPSVRAPIADSWARSLAAGVDPLRARTAPVTADPDEVAARWEAHPLAAVLPLIRALLAPVAGEAAHLVGATDADGTVLWIEGAPRDRLRAADGLNFAEGSVWDERDAGTNGIGTALAADHALQVFGAEHFSAGAQEWTCSAAPVRDPDGGAVLGAIDLTSHFTAAHPFALACAVATAEAAEARLRDLMHARDARLRARFEERVGQVPGACALVTPSGRVIVAGEGWASGERSGHGGPGGGDGQAERVAVGPGGGELLLPSGVRAFAEPLGHEEAFLVRRCDSAHGRRRPLLRLCLLGRDQAGVEVGGKPLTLSRRQTEILALLTARPAGMTSDELAAGLYGDDGQPGAVRVQVHRMRRALGRWIETDPYRLTAEVESDVARLQGLLDRGAAREAAERYDGALLPRSEAPGVVRERERLETWLRHAVMTADDPEARWAWVQTPSGDDDAPAWKRLLAELEFHDPRHTLAAARLRTLRAEQDAEG